MMTALDKESLFYKVEKIRSSLKKLTQIAKLDYQTYIDKEENLLITERLLHITIEAMLDIGNQLIASESLPSPLEYRDVFRILGREGILNTELMEKCLPLAGLTNRLVHEYEDIDHRMIHQLLQENLQDFENYLSMIVAYVNTQV